MLTCDCPGCGKKCGITEANLGRQIQCPNCKAAFHVASPVLVQKAPLGSWVRRCWIGASGAFALLAMVIVAIILNNQPTKTEPSQEDLLALKNQKDKGLQPDSKEKGDNSKILEKKNAKEGLLVERLKVGNEDERIEAAHEIAKLEKVDATTIRAVCEAATSKSVRVRNAALKALEKTSPALHGPVLSLLFDDPKDQGRAIDKIIALGDEAKPAAPILFSKLGVNYMRAFYALGSIATTEPETLEAALRAGPRIQAITLLGAIGKSDKESLKTIIPHLIGLLESKEVLESKEEVGRVCVIWVLADIGKEAKEVLQALKKLELSDNPVIESAATLAVNQIEKKENPLSYSVELSPKNKYQESRYVFLNRGSSVQIQMTSDAKFKSLLSVRCQLPVFHTSALEEAPIDFTPKMSTFYEIRLHDVSPRDKLMPSRSTIQIRTPG